MFKTFADWFQTSSKYAEDRNDFSQALAELLTDLMYEAAAAEGILEPQKPSSSLIVCPASST